jgi:RNA polymerase sigma-70 factor (ECF subfamily)
MTEREKQEQFLALYEPVHNRLYRFARLITTDADEARDLVGDTIVIAYERFETIRDRRAFLSYVFTTASRLHKRRKWRNRIFELMEDRHTEYLYDRNTSPDNSADITLFYTALGRLPSAQRECIVLFELFGFSIEEIRAIQGGSASGVKTRLVRGRKALARLLGVNDPEQLSPVLPAGQLLEDHSTDSETPVLFSGLYP